MSDSRYVIISVSPGHVDYYHMQALTLSREYRMTLN